MKFEGNSAKEIHIAYIGGGSRGWAWTLMKDLMLAKDLSGDVRLYDIDFAAAENNAVIGNQIPDTHWSYTAVRTIGEALSGADFVVISILPGTFDEMEVDVHAPEKYGIYQSVGDTTGPGGFIRAMRTVPMMEEIAHAIEKYAPKAWVINYTNPMAVCMTTLYRAFPEIRAFGCCHEVFGTQRVLTHALADICGIPDVDIHELNTEVVGINHFTWFTAAEYRHTDLFPVYRAFAEKYYEEGYQVGKGANWMNDSFACAERVKFDLFLKYGYIAAAGDRHLAEFMDSTDYLASPEQVKEWKFGLTSVAWRKNDLQNRLERAQKLRNGEMQLKIGKTGEEGVRMIRALLGLSDMITNVNLPNVGQIPNLPLGTVVETNATFRADSVKPVMAGEIPMPIYGLIRRIADEMNDTVTACMSRDLNRCRKVFAEGHLLKTLTDEQKCDLFWEMVRGTSAYLGEYHE